MKKILILVICCSLGFVLAGCGKKSAEIKTVPPPPTNSDVKILNENDVVNDLPEPTETGLRNYNIASARYNFSFSYPVSYPAPAMENHPIPSDGGFFKEDSNWRLNVGAIGRAGCEGVDCYLLYFDGYPAKDYDKTLQGLGRSSFISDLEEVVVNNSKAIIYTEAGICSNRQALFFDKNLTVKFTARCGADNSSLSEAFDEILATFAFHESPMADWQEFISPELGFSVLFPPDWTADRLNAETGAADAGGLKLRLCDMNLHPDCEYSLTVDTSAKDSKYYFDENTTIKSSKIIAVGGVEATEHVYGGQLSDLHSIILADSRKYIYIINYSFADEAERSIYRNIISQIRLLNK